ncbi:9375_t:CDS:2 [Funneliformis caledonium]|uniref:9375_t:CDS:1 n=1 Tax=Funneliformis caledonium TaxID=1117310 RepID=A0A9N9H440_9GLOM|nr:9375_t:CDS:2 [Funneliformis caledonium]
MKIIIFNTPNVPNTPDLFRLQIYLPLYETSKGPGWIELLESEKLWEDHFQPFRWMSRDYDYQIKVKDLLKAVDTLKSSVKIPVIDILRRVTASFAHSSCAIEGNTLTVHDTRAIWEKLKKNNLDILLENQKLLLPGPRSLSDKPENEAIEIRNHLLSTYLVSKFAELECEINLDDIKDIHQDRSISKSRAFDCLSKVPALMKRFIEFRDESIKNDSLHPLIIASRIFSSFNHVHPFADSNGRVARSVMAYYLIRNGYPPIVF